MQKLSLNFRAETGRTALGEDGKRIAILTRERADVQLEVEDSLNLPLAVAAGELAVNQAEVGGGDTGAWEGRLRAVECVEVVHSHRE
jgi:hypothetical protein